MRKSTYHTKTSTLKLHKPIAGMCNTISGIYLKDNQAQNISEVIYKEEENTFLGSYVFDELPAYSTSNFSRLYNVEYNGENLIFATYSGGVVDIINNKTYEIEEAVIPTDIIYNEEGLYVSSSYNVYHINNKGDINKITFSFTPYVWQRLSARQSDYGSANSIFYHSNKLYFSDNRGLGYMDTNGENITIINSSLKLLDFIVCGSTLFAFDLENIYYIAQDDASLFLNISDENLKVRIGASLDYNLLILNYENSYQVIEINTLNKSITKYSLPTLKGLGSYGEKFVRVAGNKLYLLINETDENYNKFSVSLYKLSKNDDGYTIEETIFEDFSSTLPLQDIFFIDTKFFCYFAVKDNYNNDAKEIALYECDDGDLIFLDYSNKPVALGTSSMVSVNNNRLYVGNVYGLYYIDILLAEENIPCLLVQNSRLIVPQGDTLYFSGAGDFYNWSWSSDSDALFVEIGYKEGGNIIYIALVLDSIIVFKDNGSIYRLSGNYPNWVVSKLGEIDKLTTRAITYGSEIIFGANYGIKKIGVTEYYGDFFLSDYQYKIQDKNMLDVSLNLERNSLVFVNDNYIFEYNNVISGYYIYKFQGDSKFIQVIERYNNGAYVSYSLNDKGQVFIANKEKHNDISVQYKTVKANQDMIIKAIVIFTPELDEDREFIIILGGHEKTLTLQKGKIRHKDFITKRVNLIEIEVKHTGDFFIDNVFVEYANMGEYFPPCHSD